MPEKLLLSIILRSAKAGSKIQDSTCVRIIARLRECASSNKSNARKLVSEFEV